MCYEIRTPLDIVVNNAELFEHQHTSEEEAQLIDTIKTNTSYLLNLINDILFLSRLDANMVEFSPLPCDFSKTFEGHCQTGWNGCQKEGVTYTVENHYEQLVVNIDDINVGRIIEQVVKNAAEHTVTGTVRARYEYIGGKLMVVVDDTGPGINPAVLDHIFERFNTTTAKDHRTGLGMPICKELVTQMGGTIEVTSEMGKGTTVWLAIPCEATVAERKKGI
jgi:signal transduction histidine kinase